MNKQLWNGLFLFSVLTTSTLSLAAISDTANANGDSTQSKSGLPDSTFTANTNSLKSASDSTTLPSPSTTTDHYSRSHYSSSMPSYDLANDAPPSTTQLVGLINSISTRSNDWTDADCQNAFRVVITAMQNKGRFAMHKGQAPFSEYTTNTLTKMAPKYWLENGTFKTVVTKNGAKMNFPTYLSIIHDFNRGTFSGTWYNKYCKGKLITVMNNPDSVLPHFIPAPASTSTTVDTFANTSSNANNGTNTNSTTQNSTSTTTTNTTTNNTGNNGATGSSSASNGSGNLSSLPAGNTSSTSSTTTNNNTTTSNGGTGTGAATTSGSSSSSSGSQNPLQPPK